jgi:4-amino-4-deoxy-L-arabinose transferase-like glycosyltransferase
MSERAAEFLYDANARMIKVGSLRLTPSRTVTLALLVIVLFGTAFRFFDLGGPPLWLDELFSLSFGRMPQSQLWSNWMVRETNPPLYYSLLHEWVRVFGDSAFAARAPSVLFGVVSIPAMFLVGRRLHSTPVGIVTALLTAVSSQQLQFSQQVRGYALGFLAAAFAVYALLRLTDRWLAGRSTYRQVAPDLLLYAAATSGAIYTHTTFFLLPLLANLYVMWLWVFRTPKRWPDIAAWVAANVLVVIVCSWWMWITYQQISADGGAAPVAWIERPTIERALDLFRHIYATRKFEAANYVFALLFAGIMAWGVWRLPAERRALVAIFGLGVPLGLYLISFKQPVYLERTLFWSQVVYLPVLAVGALALPGRRLGWAAAMGCVLVLLADAAVWRKQFYREPWREIGQVIAARADPADAVLTASVSSTVNFQYYCDDRCAEITQLAQRQPSATEVLLDYFEGTGVDESNIREALSGVDRIWVIHRGRGDGLDELLAGLAVEESPDVLVTDPLVDVQSPPAGGMRLSVWRVGHD